MLNNLKIYITYQKEWKLKNALTVYGVCMIKKNILFI